MLYDLSTTLKCNILCYDYSGYGYSTGTPSESEVYNDIEEVGYFIKEVLDIDQTELILLGHSLGSAPTVHLATKKNYQGVAGVALIAPLASGMSMILKGDQAFTQTKKDVFDNKKKMLDIDCPIFLIHGKKDNIIQKNVLLGTDVSNRTVPNATKKERRKCQNLYTYTYTVNSVY